ncbi:MAG TPA: hypothetical protein VF898_10060 [Chloroflexota bacterium]
MIAANNIVATFHSNWALVVVIYSVFMAVWGFFLYVRGSQPTGGYLGALAIDFGVIVIQGLVGVALVIGGHRPHDNLHFLYGFVSLLTLPAAYSYSEKGTTRRDSLVFGLAALLLVGLAIRGMMTGSG